MFPIGLLAKGKPSDGPKKKKKKKKEAMLGTDQKVIDRKEILFVVMRWKVPDLHEHY